MHVTRKQREQYLRDSIERTSFFRPELYVKVHVFVPLRLDSLRGALADFILRLQHGEHAADAVFAALVPSLSDEAVGVIRAYKHRYHEALGWVLLDEKGSGECDVNGFSQELSLPPMSESLPEPSSSSTLSSSSPGNLFTPNDQWLLKVLLLSGLDRRFWGGPVLSKSFGVSELAEVAGVPQPSASRFIAMAADHGFLRRSGRSLAMQRIPALLEQWAYYLRNSPDPKMSVRFAFSSGDAEADLEKLAINGLVAGGQVAVRVWGLAIANVGRTIFYVPHAGRALREQDLDECRPEEAVCELCQPVAARAVFEGSVRCGDRRMADILQVYLDTRLFMARGEEQAEHIFESVLAPFFREKQWH